MNAGTDGHPYDLVIVGGGIAGLCAALSASEGARVLVLDKGEASAGSSPLAQGGIAAAVGHDDSPDLHAADTIAAGAGLCDEATVIDVCAQGPEVIEWLERLGCGFDRDDAGARHLAREGGQSVARSVHWRDATGAEIVRALREAVRSRRIERVAARAESLLVWEGRCVGVWAEPSFPVIARAVLLATGGAGALWARTTNALGATGDGIGLALRVGAQLADLEFMQFHPTVLDAGAGQRVLLTEALRGHGAVLIDREGERFVDELAPRHVVAKAIVDRGGAFLDCRALPDLEVAFPTVVAGARAHGFDPVTQPLPVAPAAHYFIGGVAADAHGRTSIPGLFAAGECASTGMHGANRMAGNSLLETVVVGRRVGALAAEQPASPAKAIPLTAWGSAPMDARIPSIMWENAGPIRTEEGLARAARDLTSVPDSPQRWLCDMIVRAARARVETRGVHVRADVAEGEPSMAVRSFDRWEMSVGYLADNTGGGR